jgi:hypothetical protein
LFHVDTNMEELIEPIGLFHDVLCVGACVFHRVLYTQTIFIIQKKYEGEARFPCFEGWTL